MTHLLAKFEKLASSASRVAFFLFLISSALIRTPFEELFLYLETTGDKRMIDL